MSDTDEGALLEQGEFVEEVKPPKRRYGGTLGSCLVILVILAGFGLAGVVAVNAGMDTLKKQFEGAPDYPGPGEGEVIFEVREGDSASEIARRLKAEDVVASVDAFNEEAAGDEDSRKIQVGFYRMSAQMSARGALDVLIDKGNLVQSLVTVPEGLRVPDTLKALAAGTEIPLAKFRRAVQKSNAIGLPSYARGNPEGYLFPATYPIPPNATATSILSAMVERWRQAADEAEISQAADQLGYTEAEIMTVASLIESEANRDEDRGKVARVIYNRLETDATNGLLQLDATVNYAIGRDLGLGLTTTDLQFDSPYNTYRYPGLPPGPIEAPGDKAIAAATNPTPGPWVYYVTINLDTGETRFTESYDEFLTFKNRDLAEYCATSERC